MIKRRGKGKWYVLWLVMIAVFSSCIFLLSKYSVVATDVLEGREYTDTKLFEKAMKYETQELEEYFKLQNTITNDWGIDISTSLLSVCRGYSGDGYQWSLGELCDVNKPGEEYKNQLNKAEKEFWKPGCDLDSMFYLQRHLAYDGVVFYDYGRLYELAESPAESKYVNIVGEALSKNGVSNVKFTNIGQGCYRLNELYNGENGEEISRIDVYDMRTVQSLAKYMVQMYVYYRNKYAHGKSNFSYRFAPESMNMDVQQQIESSYEMDIDGTVNVLYSAVSYDGIYHTNAYGLDENLARDLLLPTVLSKYDDSGEEYTGYLMLDTSFEKVDTFYYGKELYDEASNRLLPLLIVAVISLLCCMATGIFIVLGWRRRYLGQKQQTGGEGMERRGFIGKFELQLFLCIASFAGIPAMIFYYWHVDNAGILSNEKKIFYFAGIIVIALLFVFLLNRFIHTTMCDSVRKRSIVLSFWDKMKSIACWFRERFYFLSSQLRYKICIISICLWFVSIVWLCACGWIYKKQEFMIWAAACMAVGVFLLLKNELSGYRRNEFYREVLEGVKRISNGELTYQMTGEYSYSEQEMADAINQIANGLQCAVEEQIKSERTKTRLITNVSHDIKTPLTSVINYVGLLKQENLEGERTREYIDVLDMKSQRLKVLIEDLIEASKISSGAIELHKNAWNLAEFLGQVNGEFADRFMEKELELVSTIPDDPVMVWADSQRIYRVMENLYINIYKYALSRTRIYLEVRQEEQQAVIILRNISEQRVEINPEELTERFVRGEESRSSDGSGLGLSIAKSLLELHGGSITISTEADLFRVTVTLPLAQDE